MRVQKYLKRALEIKEINENKEICDKLDSYQKELYKLKEPSLSNPKTVNLEEQKLAHSIGLKVYRLIEDYIKD